MSATPDAKAPQQTFEGRGPFDMIGVGARNMQP